MDDAVDHGGSRLGNVLMGALHPADGTEEHHLSVAALVRRVGDGDVREVILATDPDKEGEATMPLVLENALEDRRRIRRR